MSGPSISNAIPSQGAEGQSVNLVGSHLSSVTDVRFGAISASFTINSDFSITAIVPHTAAASDTVTATNPDGTGSHAFTVLFPGPWINPGPRGFDKNVETFNQGASGQRPTVFDQISSGNSATIHNTQKFADAGTPPDVDSSPSDVDFTTLAETPITLDGSSGCSAGVGAEENYQTVFGVGPVHVYRYLLSQGVITDNFQLLQIPDAAFDFPPHAVDIQSDGTQADQLSWMSSCSMVVGLVASVTGTASATVQMRNLKDLADAGGGGSGGMLNSLLEFFAGSDLSGQPLVTSWTVGGDGDTHNVTVDLLDSAFWSSGTIYAFGFNVAEQISHSPPALPSDAVLDDPSLDDRLNQSTASLTALRVFGIYNPPRYRYLYDQPGVPPQRQFPRDDGLGISTRRSWPPNISQQHGLRRGTVNTYQ